jgi:hypothetical protein
LFFSFFFLLVFTDIVISHISFFVVACFVFLLLHFVFVFFCNSFTNAYHGFSVQGVTEVEIRTFSSGCSNMVLQIQENAEVHANRLVSLPSSSSRRRRINSIIPPPPPTLMPSAEATTTTTTGNNSSTSTTTNSTTTEAASAAPVWGLDRIDARNGLNSAYSPKATGAGVKIYIIDVSGLFCVCVFFFGIRFVYRWFG